MANIGTLTARLGVDTRPLAQSATKMKAFTSSARRHFGNVTKSVFNLRTAVVGLVAVLGARGLARTFINVGRFVEDMGVRLKVLLGSVEEGGRLFDALATYASRVPFQLEQIMASATMLAGVMKGGREQIMSWMPLIGDLAAATGLSMQQTTEQMMRALSAGIGAADLFRERGISAFLGFQAGVKYTARETAEIISTAWQDAGSRFRGATEEMATTWTGLVSMLQDAWFRFRKTILEAGVWDSLKKGLEGVLDLAKRIEASGLIEQWAQNIGTYFEQIDWDKILNSLWEMAQIGRHVYNAVRWIVSGYIKMYQWADRILGLTEESKLIKEMETTAARQTVLQTELNRLLERRAALQKKVEGPLTFDVRARTVTGGEMLRPQLEEIENAITETRMALEKELGNYEKLQGRYQKVFETPLLPDLPEPKIEVRKNITPIVEGIGNAADAAEEATKKTEEWSATFLDRRGLMHRKAQEYWDAESKKVREQTGLMKKLERGIDNVVVGFERGLGQAVADMIVTGASFRDVMVGAFRAMLSELIAVTTQVLILKPLLESLTIGFGGGIGGFFGGIAGAIGGVFDWIGDIFNFHQGGLIRRAHQGLMLRPGETLFTGLPGEGVLNRRAMSIIGEAGLNALNRGDVQVVQTNNFGDINNLADIEELVGVMGGQIRSSLRESIV